MTRQDDVRALRDQGLSFREIGARLGGLSRQAAFLALARPAARPCRCGCGQPAPARKLYRPGCRERPCRCGCGRPAPHRLRYRPDCYRAARAPRKRPYGVDLAARTFGRRVVLRTLPATPVGRRREPASLCRCACGAEAVVRNSVLQRGTAGQCRGCAVRARTADLTGRDIGGWAVLSPAPPAVTAAGRRQARYLCRCRCGVERAVLAASLIAGGSRQCRACANRGRAAGPAPAPSRPS